MRTKILALAFVTAATLSTAEVAYAQLDFSTSLVGASNSVTISMSPNNPSAGQNVHLVAQSSYLDLAGSTLVWYVNGKKLSGSDDQTSVDVTAGAVGTKTKVEVDVQAPNNVQASATVTIAPTDIDLLFDSDSYVPPFYRGRALPSAGTNLRLQVIAHFKRADGSSIAASDITYTWRQNGSVVGRASGKGKSTAILPSPALFGTDTISVQATSPDGVMSGNASITLPSVEPILMVYEDHPLFGVLFNKALTAQTSIPDSEMTFAAIPLFAQAGSPNDSRLVYAWKVNGSLVKTDSADPSEITINADKSSGQAGIDLEVTHTSNFFMDSQGHWSVTFSNGSASGSNDLFHSQFGI